MKKNLHWIFIGFIIVGLLWLVVLRISNVDKIKDTSSSQNQEQDNLYVDEVFGFTLKTPPHWFEKRLTSRGTKFTKEAELPQGVAPYVLSISVDRSGEASSALDYAHNVEHKVQSKYRNACRIIEPSKAVNINGYDSAILIYELHINNQDKIGNTSVITAHYFYHLGKDVVVVMFTDGNTTFYNRFPSMKPYMESFQHLSKKSSLEGKSHEYFERAEKAFENRKYDEALDNYSKTIDLEPSYSLSYKKRALIYLIKNQFVDAIADFTKCMELDPTDSTTLSGRGAVYYEMGEYKKSIEDYNRAIELKPKDDFTPYYNRGLSYEAKGELMQAAKDYTTTINFAPRFVKAYYSRILVYYKLGQKTKATPDLQMIINLSPNSEIGIWAKKELRTLK